MEKYSEFFKYLSYGVSETVASQRCGITSEELDEKMQDAEFIKELNKSKAIFECDAMESIAQSLHEDPDMALKTIKMINEYKEKQRDVLPDFMALIHDDDEDIV